MGRTSRSALTCQTPYVIAKMPMKAIAVLDFQFEGRVHQPPSALIYSSSRINRDEQSDEEVEYRFCFGKRNNKNVYMMSFAWTRLVGSNIPAGDQTALGY